eukprot:6323588-Prymnesium_polylepis.1
MQAGAHTLCAIRKSPVQRVTFAVSVQVTRLGGPMRRSRHLRGASNELLQLGILTPGACHARREKHRALQVVRRADLEGSAEQLGRALVVGGPVLSHQRDRARRHLELLERVALDCGDHGARMLRLLELAEGDHRRRLDQLRGPRAGAARAGAARGEDHVGLEDQVEPHAEERRATAR